MIGIPLAAGLLVSYWGSMRWLKIKREVCRTDKRVGFKVLLLSDFHAVGTRRTNERMWEKIHALDFDMTAITGDLLQNKLSQLKPLAPHLRRLAARGPVYFVDGNHEKLIYSQLFAELEKLGVTPLHNRRIHVNAGLDIVGLSDYYQLKRERFPGIAKLFAGDRSPVNSRRPADSRNEKFVLVLSHQPQIIDVIRKFSPDLLLCGHTHGGQVRLPLLPALYAPGQGLLPKYDHGWYREGNTDVFISKGIGATHFHIRLFNRPEVAVIEIGPDD